MSTHAHLEKSYAGMLMSILMCNAVHEHTHELLIYLSISLNEHMCSSFHLYKLLYEFQPLLISVIAS